MRLLDDSLVAYEHSINVALPGVSRHCVQFKVYGVSWRSSKEAYTPAEAWSATDAQKLEMLVSDELVDLQRCC